jgi:hypothetical protein
MAPARPSAVARKPRLARRGIPSMTARQLAAYWEARDVLRRLQGACAGLAPPSASSDASSSRT